MLSTPSKHSFSETFLPTMTDHYGLVAPLDDLDLHVASLIEQTPHVVYRDPVEMVMQRELPKVALQNHPVSLEPFKERDLSVFREMIDDVQNQSCIASRKVVG